MSLSDQAIDRYLERIGYTGSTEVSRSTLHALHEHHVRAVPFENIDVLLGQRINLDPAVIHRKIVENRRGGYCFEQNTLFRDVLQRLGFAVTPLLARVRWQVPPEVTTPLTHMVLRVEIGDDRWLADVGFGGIGTPEPLRLQNSDEQATTHETRRLLTEGDFVVHQVQLGGSWQDVYRFSLTPPPAIDFELGNWFSCTHPRALFVNHLVVTRVEPDGRKSLFNLEFTRRDLAGHADTTNVSTREHLEAVLADEFGLRLAGLDLLRIPAVPWPN